MRPQRRWQSTLVLGVGTHAADLPKATQKALAKLKLDASLLKGLDKELNVPNAWMLQLWGAKGEKWGENFTRRLFEELKPQQRREGMVTTMALTVAGESHANIPGPEWLAKSYVKKGAPMGYHCLTPVHAYCFFLLLNRGDA